MCGDTKGVIYLNSNDNSSNSLQSAIYNKIRYIGAKKVGCASYKFISKIQNINDYNHTGVIDTGSQSYDVTIPNGQYNETQLALAVQTELNTLGLGVFSVVYDVATGKFNIVAPIAVFFEKNPITGYRDFFDMMGLQKDTVAPSINTSSVFLVNLVYTDCVYIVSNELNKSRDKREFNSNYATDHIVCIYLDSSGSVSSRIENIKYIDIAPLGALDIIDIQVLDEEGRPLESQQFKYIMELYTM